MKIWCLIIKVALRVEKTEVFKKGWNIANQTYFTSCKMKKKIFQLWAKETAFFPYFYQWNYFTQRWAICLRSQLQILLEHLYIFKHKHKSNIPWIKKQLLMSNQPYKEVLEVKCQTYNFISILSFTDDFEDFGHIFPTCFLQNFSYL